MYKSTCSFGFWSYFTLQQVAKTETVITSSAGVHKPDALPVTQPTVSKQQQQPMYVYTHARARARARAPTHTHTHTHNLTALFPGLPG